MIERLQGLTSSYDEKTWLEADEYTRILHRVLYEQGIEHSTYAGIFTAYGYECPFHMWIQVGDVIIDYRARNWFHIASIQLSDEQLHAIPHGIFSHDQKVITYDGMPVEVELLDDTVFFALLEPPPDGKPYTETIVYDHKKVEQLREGAIIVREGKFYKIVQVSIHEDKTRITVICRELMMQELFDY